MGLITEWVEVGLANINIKHFEKLGYEIPREYNKRQKQWRVIKGTKIKVKVKDLMKGSTVPIDYSCDNLNCDNISYNISYQIYLRTKKEHDDKSYCHKCAMKLYGTEKSRISYMKNTDKINHNSNYDKSIYGWCVENNDLEILNRWDDENKYKPTEIGYGSKIPIKLKCPRNIHPSEEKLLNSYTSRKGDSLNCKMCNSLGQWLIDNNREDVFHLVVNKDKSYLFSCSYGCTNMIWWKCENDKHENYQRSITASLIREFRCADCVRERTESFLQEKVRLYLEELCYKYNWKLNHEYKCILNCPNPDKSLLKKRRLPYDNEVLGNNFNLIIEVHGKQHYEKSSLHIMHKNKHSKNSLDEEFERIQKYDLIKKEYAISNNYLYLEIPYNYDDKKESWKVSINNILRLI